MSTVIHPVVTIDDKPCYELNSTEVVFRISTAKTNAPIYFHMRPYAATEMKTALAGLKARIKDAGAKILSEEADPAPLHRLFDATFIRMSNIAGTDGAEPSIEEQRAWLDRNPRLKSRVITEGFCTVFFRRTTADAL